MDSRLTVILSDKEREALQAMAQSQLRPLRDQARYLLREGLIERGLLEQPEPEPRAGGRP